ncbi:MAG TPA: DNA-binding domain-containing protein [Usitatibacter sp.]|jgi:hypothetical protein|nr:DNA-binding domain-containing protein [Usitatibacter sp.]
MPSLRELQLRFAHAVTAPRAPADPRLGIYRHNIASNLRNALGATYRATRAVMGADSFEAAADAYARRSPPGSGDLNLYGDGFAAFLEGDARAARLDFIPDLARLEWAFDEAARSAECDATPAEVLEALARAAAAARPFGLALHPSCTLLVSRYRVLAAWQAHAPAPDGEGSDSAAGERLLVRREGERPCVERLDVAEHAWLAACSSGATLEAAAEHALELDARFELVERLRARIADGTVVGVH